MLFKKGLELAEEIGSHHSNGVLIGHMGGVYHAQQKYPEALKHFEDQLQIYMSHGFENSPDIEVIKKNINFLKKELKI